MNNIIKKILQQKADGNSTSDNDIIRYCVNSAT